MRGTTVRPALAKDVDQICALMNQLGYAVPAAEIASSLETIRQSAEHAVLVADIAGTVVGWIHVRLSLALTHGLVSEIAGMVVEESYRGKGIGTTLVQAAEEWAGRSGTAKMRVRSRVNREEAHHFYERLGYAAEKDSRVFSKKL